LNYIPELVYLYSKTGQMKRALYLIIDRLGDVSRAIAFAKEQNDPDLWEDLLNYSMDKPRFIRALLDEVGTAIDPITLVRRIPEGLEIPGLREGLKHMMKEHEIQFSISSGVARVLRSEVATAQTLLRNGQRKGVKFEVAIKKPDHMDVTVEDVQADAADDEKGDEGEEDDVTGDQEYHQNGEAAPRSRRRNGAKAKKWQPGHCAKCFEPFADWEAQTLVGFACGHIFHLAHLLELVQPHRPIDPELLGGADLHSHGDGEGLAGGEWEAMTHRGIGAKVRHARLLRDGIEGGCPVCKGDGLARER
jgi:hypothetical protein